MNISKYINQAKATSFGLKKLNFILGIGIPFNKPHRIKIFKLTDHTIQTIIPYRRKNFNHIKGIHACALATTSEFASGFLLMSNLDFRKYRLIMEKIEMEYHYQAKLDCFANTELQEEWMNENIYMPLEKDSKISIINTVKTFDKENNHICTANITWQIKLWSKVKTKL